jgi:hypothetical protein
MVSQTASDLSFDWIRITYFISSSSCRRDVEASPLRFYILSDRSRRFFRGSAGLPP